MIAPAGLIAGALAAVFASGVLRGFTGFGFALAATPLLTLLMPPQQAVPMVLILQAGSTFVGIRTTIARFERRSTLLLGAGALVATPVGVGLLRVVSADAARIAIALATIAAVIVLLAGPRGTARRARGPVLPFGLAAGLFGGMCAMPGPPVLAFYLGAGVAPPVARASMTLVFLTTSSVALATAAATGLIGGDAVRLALVTAPAMIAGTWLGGRLFERAPAALYRKTGIGALVAIAIVTGWRALA